MLPEDVVSKVLGVPRRTVTDTTSNATAEGWDSLAHVMLVLELEATYGVPLSTADALAMTDVASIKRVLQVRGARW